MISNSILNLKIELEDNEVLKKEEKLHLVFSRKQFEKLDEYLAGLMNKINDNNYEGLMTLFEIRD
jgi:hypothetical protein